MANFKDIKGQNIDLDSIMDLVNYSAVSAGKGYYNNNNKVVNSTFVPNDNDLDYYLIGEDIQGTNTELTEEEELNAVTINVFAPLRDLKQISSIVGAPGCGKTTSMKNLLKFYAKYCNITKMAVISINERADEAEVWKELNLKHLYCIASNDMKYTADEKIEIIKGIIDRVNADSSIELVVLDSITGWYNLIANSNKPATKGFGDGGYRIDIFDDIWRIISNIKSKYLLCSIIQNSRSKAYTVLNDEFNSKADSTIYLEADLTRMNIFNNINPYKSFTRRVVYTDIRNDAIKLLNKFGGSFKALIAMGVIPKDDYGKDFIYPFN